MLDYSQKSKRICSKDMSIIIMPREPYNRDGENHTKGLSPNSVRIVCAIDEFGDFVAKATATGEASGLK